MIWAGSAPLVLQLWRLSRGRDEGTQAGKEHGLFEGSERAQRHFASSSESLPGPRFGHNSSRQGSSSHLASQVPRVSCNRGAGTWTPVVCVLQGRRYITHLPAKREVAPARGSASPVDQERMAARELPSRKEEGRPPLGAGVPEALALRLRCVVLLALSSETLPFHVFTCSGHV